MDKENTNIQEFERDMKRLNNIPRDYYIRIYRLLGENMWNKCQIPTVGDFASILKDSPKSKQRKMAEAELNDLTSFTGNADDIKESLEKRELNYTNEQSDKFMNKVIASNITDISDSGWFYKKLISSADNMKVDEDAPDCGSVGVEYKIDDITEDLYDFKIKFQFINEIDGYCPLSWDEFNRLMQDIKKIGDGYIHVRTPLTCQHSHDHRTICPVCAGIVKRSNEPNNIFIPKNFGVYSTLMITEHATQASLDSMNNGQSENLNKILDRPIKAAHYTWDEAKKIIEEIVDEIGNIGVQARFYEIALMSRFYELDDGTFRPSSMMFSFKNQGDLLGQFIYAPTEKAFSQLISSNSINATSIKSKIMFDIYE